MKAAGRMKWKRGKSGEHYPVRISGGLINFKEVQKMMASKNIELRGGGADESPDCYKKLNDVLKYHKDTLRILHRLKPIGVAMAGEDVYDPYKD
jgi:tRNA-splicing ligase RtcB